MSSTTDIRQKVFRIPTNIVVSAGLCWDYIGAEPLDLDLSAVCFTKGGQFLDVVFFNHLFPEGTDEEALREDYLVDVDQLPYMFLSGDSNVGGEEENQMPGIALAAKRRKNYVPQKKNRRTLQTVADDIFNRLYEEEELAGVQEAVDAAHFEGGDVGMDNGVLVHKAPRRELCDEVLTFVMNKIPAEAEIIFLCVTSYTGVDFTPLNKVRLVLYNETTNERVGMIDLKSATGDGTANLSAMLVRVPQETQGGDSEEYWDLRELNVRTFGYTFVDVLALMEQVLGVPANSRMDALSNLPDYSLEKQTQRFKDQPLSDVRFGIGWSGEHDLDAFMVLLDDSNNYIDHIYPKDGKLLSAVEHLARHSGDAHSATTALGDEEFIDLMAYRLPKNVRTIVVGATYMDSFGAEKDDSRSIYDVPFAYLRLQNRTLENPYSFEVDRWNIYKEFHDGGAHDVEVHHEEQGKKSSKKKRVSKTYVDSDRKKQPVRTVLLGVMLKKGMAPFSSLFPDGRRIDQHYKRHDSEAPEVRRNSYFETSTAFSMEAGPTEEIPLFEFIPIHQHLPIDPRSGFSNVIPMLQAVSSYLAGSGANNGPAAITTATTVNQNSTYPTESPAASPFGYDATSRDYSRTTLDRENNLVGWDHSNQVAVGGLGARSDQINEVWKDVSNMDNVRDRYAIQVQFLEVMNLEPQLPDRFKCHCEAWVYGRNTIPPRNRDLTLDDNKPYKTPSLVNRDKLQWSEGNSSASALFVVHQYDRIRISLYEFASFGQADIELSQLSELWSGVSENKYGSVEKTIRLKGAGPLFRADVRVKISRVSMKSTAVKKMKRNLENVNEKRERHEKEVDKKMNEKANNSSNCVMM